jgi:AraC-like DNA-binding protein
MKQTRLAQLLNRVAVREGTHETSVPGVMVARTSYGSSRCPVIYEPMIYIIAQGQKIGYLGDDVFRYNADNYLVLSVPLPLQCEWVASPEEPLLAVKIAVDPTMLVEMLMDLDEPAHGNGAVPRGIHTTPLTTELSDAVMRLLECVGSPIDSRVLGRQTVREIIYRVLRGEQGGALRAMASRNDQFIRIARVLQSIHADYARSLSTEEMAKLAGMSVSTFHHSFKAVTATSPLQYVKSVRLHRARTMMVQDKHNASTAAVAVGYESASQFGREFKRFFGSSPAEEAASLRAAIRRSEDAGASAVARAPHERSGGRAGARAP